MKERKKILILGAGPVGLISGWLLSKKNWEVKIFEKNFHITPCFIRKKNNSHVMHSLCTTYKPVINKLSTCGSNKNTLSCTLDADKILHVVFSVFLYYYGYLIIIHGLSF